MKLLWKDLRLRVHADLATGSTNKIIFNGNQHLHNHNSAKERLSRNRPPLIAHISAPLPSPSGFYGKCKREDWWVAQWDIKLADQPACTLWATLAGTCFAMHARTASYAKKYHLNDTKTGRILRSTRRSTYSCFESLVASNHRVSSPSTSSIHSPQWVAHTVNDPHQML